MRSHRTGDPAEQPAVSEAGGVAVRVGGHLERKYKAQVKGHFCAQYKWDAGWHRS